MSSAYGNLVQETTTTSGTGTITLNGAMSGYAAFASINTITGQPYVATGQWTAYCLKDGTAREVGVGQFTSPNILTRTTVIWSTNANAKIVLSGGGTVVTLEIPVHKRPTLDENGRMFFGGTNLQAIANLNMVADESIYSTGADVWAKYSLTAAGRALIDDTSAANQLVTLGALAKDGSIAMTGLLTLSGNAVTSLQAIPLQQLQSAVQGLDWKESCRVRSTAQIALTGAPPIIDTIQTSVGDRVLIMNQTLPQENGIYTMVASGTWPRATDMDSWDTEVVQATVGISDGAAPPTGYRDTAWVCTANLGGTLGATAINFTNLPVGTIAAGVVSFAPATSGMAATFVQGAIDEVEARVDLLEATGGKAGVKCATTAALPAHTRSGDVLTASAVGVLTVDGINPAINERIIVKNEPAQGGDAIGIRNGVFTLTTVGTAGVAWVLTRSIDFNSWPETVNASLAVELGTVNKNSIWSSTTVLGGTLNTTPIFFKFADNFVNVASFGMHPQASLAANATAFNAAAVAAAAINGTMWFPPGLLYKMESGCTHDTYKVAIEGNGSWLDFETTSATSGTYVWAWNSSSSEASYGPGIRMSKPVRNLVISGPAYTTGVNGILVSATQVTPAALAGMSIEGVAFYGFNIAAKLGKGVHNCSFQRCLWQNHSGRPMGTAVLFSTDMNDNGGERILFSNCHLGAALIAFQADCGSLSVFAHNTSLVYLTQIAVNTNRGLLHFSECHIESNLDTNYWFVQSDPAGGLIAVENCEILLMPKVVASPTPIGKTAFPFCQAEADGAEGGIRWINNKHVGGGTLTKATTYVSSQPMAAYTVAGGRLGNTTGNGVIIQSGSSYGERFPPLASLNSGGILTYTDINSANAFDFLGTGKSYTLGTGATAPARVTAVNIGGDVRDAIRWVMAASTAPPAASVLEFEPIAIKGGGKILVNGAFGGNAVSAGCQLEAAVQWYTAARVVIGAEVTSLIIGGAINFAVWTGCTNDFTAPAGAAFGIVKVRLVATGTTAGNTQLHSSPFQVEALDAGMPQVWGPAFDGTAALPGFSFFADPDNGYYRIGANNWGRSVGGTLRETYSTTDDIQTLPQRGADGLVSAPQYSFSADTDNGLYRIGTNNPAMAAAGSLVHSWNALGNTQPIQPAFLARQNAAIGNLTGGGILVDAALPAGGPFLRIDTEVFDQGNNYDPATGIFTAPVTGRYNCGFSLQIRELAGTQASPVNTRVTGYIFTSNRIYTVWLSNGFIYETGSGTFALMVTGSVLADMDLGDQMYPQLKVDGGTKVVDLDAAVATTPLSVLWAYLVA